MAEMRDGRRTAVDPHGKAASRRTPELGRTRTARVGAVLFLAAALLAIVASSASAAYVHTNVTGEYGKEGTKASGLGGGCRLGYDSTSHHLYLDSDSKIYGLSISGGTATPLGGGFPVNAGINTGCGEPDIGVDSSVGNIYAVQSGQSGQVYGWNSSGAVLSGYPVSVPGGGEICGVDAGPNGESWAGDYSQKKVFKSSASGVSEGSVNVGFSVCKVVVDRSNGDLYAASYGGGELVKFTASSGYTDSVNFPAPGGEPAMAINGAEHKLYIGTGSSSVKVYSTETGGLIETIELGESGGQGIAVDENTDTLFVTVGFNGSGYIEERPGIVVPDATVGEPTAFATLHGHVDPAGGGNVTSCNFEYSTSPEFNSVSTSPCSPAVPYSGVEDVSADLTGHVTAETRYYYRLSVGNANGTNKSAAKSFTPHFVPALKTEAATQVERTSAELHASFLGNGEDTHYFFEWGTDASYGHSTTSEDAGSPSTQTPVSAALSDLEPSITYHYRVVAINNHGTSRGDDETFTTKPAVTAVTTEAATDVLATTANLNGSFTGDGLNVAYFFEWGSSSSYGNKTAEGELIAPNGPTQIPATELSGLQGLHTYHYRVVAKNSIGTTYGADRTFTTFSGPVVLTQSSSGVNATEATLHAVINPHGAETEYHFEYGPTTNYGSTAPASDGLLPASEADEPVEVHLTGLNGGVYHFRVVATNQFGSTVSGDQSFNFYAPECPNSTVRQQTGSNSLPDCRAYELVTPEDQGITIIYPSAVPFSATANAPSKLAFVGAYGLIPNSGEPANNVGDTYVSTRTDTGWTTKYVGIPSSQTSMAGGPPWANAAFEPDKWDANVVSDPSLSRLVDWDKGRFEDGGTFESLEHTGSSNAPYVWDTTTGKQADRWPTNLATVPGGEHFKGRTAFSADLSHFVFTSNIPFAVGGEPGDLYDNNTVKATVTIASVLEGGAHIKNAVPQAVSDDGSHIVMAVRGGEGTNIPKEGPGELYVRVDEAATFEIAPGHSVNYLDMTPDGKKIYISSSAQLTPEDTDSSTDIYMWSEENPSPNHLKLISGGNEPNAGNTDECSSIWTSQCNVVPISFNTYTSAQGGSGGIEQSENFVADNGDIYFLSPEQLAGNNGVNGEENLYDYRNGRLQFVASLEPTGVACTPDQGGEICSENAVARMEINKDDSYMAFLTGSKVTGYDNAGKSEMYRYAPASEEMICVSCLPNGEPPTGSVTASHNGRYMAEDGRTFFETADPLVPQDTNKAADVYEYVEGRPQLITSGTNPGNSIFSLATIMALPGLVGVSADGTDVYFATYDTLVGQDRNGEAVKIYDARSGGGFKFNPPVPPCAAADECHGASSSAPGNISSGTGAELGSTGNIQSSGAKKKPSTKKKKAEKKKHKSAKRKKVKQKRQKGRRNG